MSKILIVGANSALAKDVITVLSKGNTIFTAGKKDCDIYCDVTKAIDFPDGIDAVINFAAAFGGESDEEILKAQETNTEGILNICVASKRAGIKHIINMSSIFTLLHEGAPQYSIYSITKKQGDELARFYCNQNELSLTILKPSQVYGDSESFAKNQPFFYRIVDNARKGEDILIYGRHDPLRNYIHSMDIAEIINRVIGQDLVGTFVCMNPSDVTYSQIAKSAQKIFGKGGEVTFVKDKPDIPDNIFKMDLEIYDKLGYSPQISIDDGLNRIKQYRDNL